MNLVHNERVKLLATLMNTVAAAAFVAGLLTPFSIALLNGGGATVSPRGAAYAVFWLVFGILLHVIARRALRGLKE